MFKSEKRLTYGEIKALALDGYYDSCRDSGLVDRRSHEQVMGRVDYMFEDGFERPIEELMWRIVLLVLSGGWHPDWELHARTVIKELLRKNEIHRLLVEVPKEEAASFLHDLEILKFCEK